MPTLLLTAESAAPGNQIEGEGSRAKSPEQYSAAGEQEDELNYHCRQLSPAEQQIHYTECQTAGHALSEAAVSRRQTLAPGSSACRMICTPAQRFRADWHAVRLRRKSESRAGG